MNIYLIRHADALPMDMQTITSDAERPLSEVGAQQTAALATTFKQMSLQLDQVFTSPLKRAVQTAEQLCQGLEQANLQAVTCNFLAPGESSRRLRTYPLHKNSHPIAPSGHEPDLGLHTAYFIGSKRARIEFAKGGAACVNCDQAPRKGTGVLLWLVTPNWLNR